MIPIFKTLDAYTAAVIVPPSLVISQATTNGTIVSWPNPSMGFILQKSAGMAPASWMNSSTTPGVVSG
jgi:hypothetical protein